MEDSLKTQLFKSVFKRAWVKWSKVESLLSLTAKESNIYMNVIENASRMEVE